MGPVDIYSDHLYLWYCCKHNVEWADTHAWTFLLISGSLWDSYVFLITYINRRRFEMFFYLNKWHHFDIIAIVTPGFHSFVGIVCDCPKKQKHNRIKNMEVAAGLVAAEQVVSTSAEAAIVAGVAIAKPTQPLTATFSRIATSASSNTASVTFHFGLFRWAYESCHFHFQRCLRALVNDSSKWLD